MISDWLEITPSENLKLAGDMERLNEFFDRSGSCGMHDRQAEARAVERALDTLNGIGITRYPGVFRLDFQHGVNRNGGGQSAGADQPNDVGLAAAVGEELVDCIPQVAVLVQARRKYARSPARSAPAGLYRWVRAAPNRQRQ